MSQFTVIEAMVVGDVEALKNGKREARTQPT